MLEALYKIPSRIITERLTTTLPHIIGPHQHGFVRGRAAQEASIKALHAIAEANKHDRPLQLVSFDIAKAFDKISHQAIIQTLQRMGFPIIITQVIQFFFCTGTA